MPEIALELFYRLRPSSLPLSIVTDTPRNLAIFWDYSLELRMECAELVTEEVDPNRTALLIDSWYICDWEHEKPGYVCIGTVGLNKVFEPQHLIEKQYYGTCWYLRYLI